MAITRSALRRKWNAEFDRHKRAQRELVQILEDAIKDMSAEYHVRPVPFVVGRLKDFGDFCRKAERYERDGRVTTAAECFNEIKDIVRARIICQTLSDADRLRRMLEDYRPNLAIVRDVEVHAGERTGYRGIHLDMSIDVIFAQETVTTLCEVQVQTALQFAWGLYTHKDIYKGENVPLIVGDLMVQLSELLNVADKVAGRLLAEIEATHQE